MNVACVWDLIQNRYNHEHYDTELFEILNIKDDTQVRLSFAYIMDEDMSHVFLILMSILMLIRRSSLQSIPIRLSLNLRDHPYLTVLYQE